jgi:antitoxin component of MazEF toxin-antitoxin module
MGASYKRNKVNKVSAKQGITPKIINRHHKISEITNELNEPVASYTSRIRAIGNSKGVILNNQVIEAAGLKPGIDIIIQAGNGIIIIAQLKETGVNTDLSSWDKHFKAAMKRGAKPEQDLFEGIKNDFDEKEW